MKEKRQKSLRIQEIDCEDEIDNTALAIGMYIQDSSSPAAN